MPVLPRSGRRHSGVRHALFHARTGGAQRVGGRDRLVDRPRRSLSGRRGPLVWKIQQQQQQHQIDRQTDRQTTNPIILTYKHKQRRTDICLFFFRDFQSKEARSEEEEDKCPPP